VTLRQLPSTARHWSAVGVSALIGAHGSSE
jgi:hypothetical protein